MQSKVLCKSKFSYIEIWFVDKNNQPLGIEHKVILTLAMNQYKEIMR